MRTIYVIDMPTNKQVEWLKAILEGKIKKSEDPHKYSVYMNRIRKDVDDDLERFKWIADNANFILTDEEYEVQRFGTTKHRRLIKFLEIVKSIMPEANPTLVKLKRETGLEEDPLV